MACALAVLPAARAREFCRAVLIFWQVATRQARQLASNSNRTASPVKRTLQLAVTPLQGSTQIPRLALVHRPSEAPPEGYKIPSTAPTFARFFFSSLALFAFWLRSSVVSVLFSLISESALRSTIVIILIFATRLVFL